MAITSPAPSAPYGVVILQPCYFTSSLFVNDLREDIATLIESFNRQVTASPQTQPFSLFKSLWKSQGWTWFHLMVLDDRARQVFLNTVLRLFLERTVSTEPALTRATGLFAFYTFLYTQPTGTAPSLWSIHHVPIALDHLDSLATFTVSCKELGLPLFQATLHYIYKKLETDAVFMLVPSSDLYPLNPRELPREIYVEDSNSYSTETDVPKKKGRPSKRDKAKKARANLEKLDSRLDQTAMITSPQASLDEYKSEKADLLERLRTQPSSSQARAIVTKSNRMVLDRLKAAEGMESSAPSDAQSASVARIERSVYELDQPNHADWSGGALTLVEGSGLSPVHSTTG